MTYLIPSIAAGVLATGAYIAYKLTHRTQEATPRNQETVTVETAVNEVKNVVLNTETNVKTSTPQALRAAVQTDGQVKYVTDTEPNKVKSAFAREESPKNVLELLAQELKNKGSPQERAYALALSGLLKK